MFFVVAAIPDPKMVSASGTLTLQPGAEGKDSYVFGMYPDQNFSNSTELRVADCGPPPCARSLLQFNLSTIPSDVTIISATLELYYYSWFSISDTSSTLPVSRINSSWDENTVTWNNQPAISDTPIGLMAVASGQYGWKLVDIKNQIVNWLDGSQANYGLMVGYQIPPAQNGKDFYSSNYTESIYRPKVTITYEEKENQSDPVGTITPDSGNNSDDGIGEVPSGEQPKIPVAEAPPSEKVNDQTSTDSIRQEISVNQQSIPPPANIRGIFSDLVGRNLDLILLALAGVLGVAAVAIIFIESLSTGFSLKEIVVMLVNFIYSFFSFRKSDKSGIVYDQTTNKPLRAAIVLIYRLPEIKLISVKTTDRAGHFIFPVDAGKYAISVKKRGFISPSHLAKSQDVYLGQTLDLSRKSIINVKIPLDPTPKLKSKPSTIRLLLYSTVIRFTVLLSGTILSIFSLIYLTGWRTYLILAGYFLIWIIEYLIQMRVIKFSKVMETDSRRPVDLAILRIIDRKGRIVQTFVSDDQGYLIPYAARKDYKIIIERIGYKKFEEEVKIKGYIEHRTFKMERV